MTTGDVDADNLPVHQRRKISATDVNATKSVEKKNKTPSLHESLAASHVSKKKRYLESKSNSKSSSAKSSTKRVYNAAYVREHCWPHRSHLVTQDCGKVIKWQEGKYVKDECGSGIVPLRREFGTSRDMWCHTPLSMYQATIGELGRKVLCKLITVPRDVKPGPPCNIDHYVMPPCGGYYRKYDCIRECEEDFATVDRGRKLYRDPVIRYWDPCMSKEARSLMNKDTFAHHNVALGIKIKRKLDEQPCW